MDFSGGVPVHKKHEILVFSEFLQGTFCCLRGPCLGVGACLKVNTRALGRGALHKKGDLIPLLLTSGEIGAEPVEGPSLDQYERSSIPII